MPKHPLMTLKHGAQSIEYMSVEDHNDLFNKACEIIKTSERRAYVHRCTGAELEVCKAAEELCDKEGDGLDIRHTATLKRNLALRVSEMKAARSSGFAKRRWTTEAGPSQSADGRHWFAERGDVRHGPFTAETCHKLVEILEREPE